MNRNEKELDTCLAYHIKKSEFPGVAVCIRGPEGVLFEKGYGYRDAEMKKGVDGNTVFGIASMSKSMTTLACCILAAEGKLSLEDPITKYFPKLHIPGIPDECVTLKMLGEHRAGIPPIEPLEWSIVMNSKERDRENVRKLRSSAPNDMSNIDQIVDYLAEARYGSLGMPGEFMSYSNEAYALLSYVVDMAAGISLEQFLMERIFEPLGMSRSILDLDCSEAKERAGDDNVTSLFERDEETGALICDDDWSVLPPFRGCACVKSTSLDITKYYQMLSNYGRFEGKQIIPEEAVDLLIGREYPLKKKPFYCMGLRKSLVDNKMLCEHAGGLHGVSTMGGFIEGGYSVAVLCNQGDVDMLKLQWICYNYILGLPLETEHYWAMPSGKEFSQPEMLCGRFVCHEGVPSYCVVRYENGKLECEHDGLPLDLRHCEKTVFATYDLKEPEKRIGTFRFYIRDGKAWGVKCGSRIYQRTEDE